MKRGNHTRNSGSKDPTVSRYLGSYILEAPSERCVDQYSRRLLRSSCDKSVPIGFITAEGKNRASGARNQRTVHHDIKYKCFSPSTQLRSCVYINYIQTDNTSLYKIFCTLTLLTMPQITEIPSSSRLLGNWLEVPASTLQSPTQQVVTDENYTPNSLHNCSESPLSEQLEPIAVVGMGKSPAILFLVTRTSHRYYRRMSTSWRRQVTFGLLGSHDRQEDWPAAKGSQQPVQY